MIVILGQIVFAAMAAAFTLMAITLAVMVVSVARDGERLYSIGERLFQGIFGIILCVFCAAGTGVLAYLAFNFPSMA